MEWTCLLTNFKKTKKIAGKSKKQVELLDNLGVTSRFLTTISSWVGGQISCWTVGRMDPTTVRKTI